MDPAAFDIVDSTKRTIDIDDDEFVNFETCSTASLLKMILVAQEDILRIARRTRAAVDIARRKNEDFGKLLQKAFV